MAFGIFAYVNRFLAATFSGSSAWSAAHPLENLKSEEDYVGAPARCLDAHDLSRTWFQAVLPQPRVLSVLALLFHTLSIASRYRIRGTLLEDAAFVTPTFDTGWQWVYPSLNDPVDLEIDDDNFITGTVLQEEIDLLGRHLYVPLPTALAQRYLIEIDDQLHPLGWFDIGGIYGASGFSPAINFERGRELTVVARDKIDVTPAGRRIVDPYRPQRVLTVSYANLEDAEARRFMDAALGARQIGTVLFIPNLDDAAGTMREAFPATMGRLPGNRFGWPGLASTSVAFEEILA